MGDAGHPLIVGASARAAAFSALRAGVSPWCVDLFADADLRLRCPALRLRRSDYPQGFLQAAEAAPPGPWLYTGGLENWPTLVRRLARQRPLWGNDAAVLRRVRSPLRLCRILRDAGLPFPAVRAASPGFSPQDGWLIKPRAGAGGSGIRVWNGRTPPAVARRQVYLQEYLEGPSWAAVFLGSGRQAQLLGVTRQLVGQEWLHAAPFHYCGSIGPLPLTATARDVLGRLGKVLVREAGLQGIFGVDCILRDDMPWPVEVNPRYTASVEVLEYAGGPAALALHRSVFDPGASAAASPAPEANRPLVGKAILFARASLVFPTDGPWLAALQRQADPWHMPAFADIPAAGEKIAAGRPVLTLFARGGSVPECQESLREMASALDRRLFG